ELVGDHLRHRRLVTLAERLAAGRDHDLAGQVHADVGALPEAGAPALAGRADPGRRRDAADLDVAREADPEVTALLTGRGLLAPEALVVDELERPVERALVVAAVVGEAGEDPGVVREGVGLDEVLPAHLDRVEPELAGDEVDCPLDRVRGLRP